MGCNGGAGTYSDGSDRVLTVDGIKQKLDASETLDDVEKDFVAFHINDFDVAAWAKILRIPESDVDASDVRFFASPVWTRNNLTRAEYQALLAESDGCSTTILRGSGMAESYTLPGCTTFPNANRPDIVVPGVRYAIHFYNQIDKPADWTDFTRILISRQTSQTMRILNEQSNRIDYRSSRLDRGFSLIAELVTEGPTDYLPAFKYANSPSPIILEEINSGSYLVHHLEEQYVNNISNFNGKDRNALNVNVIRVPRTVSMFRYDRDAPPGEQYIFEKPTHQAYQNSNDPDVRGYEGSAGFLLPRSLHNQYVVFLGLEPVKDYVSPCTPT